MALEDKEIWMKCVDGNLGSFIETPDIKEAIEELVGEIPKQKLIKVFGESLMPTNDEDLKDEEKRKS